MKLRNDIERQIYASTFVVKYSQRHDAGPKDCHREFAAKEGRDVVECWEATIAMWAIEDAEAFVHLYRKGLKEFSS